MQFDATDLPGCFFVRAEPYEDQRGRFIKPYNRSAFSEAGINSDWAEAYWSVSERGVLRGLHFQAPPDDHAKLVWCVTGRAFDVVLDLRQGSTTYGQHVARELNGLDGVGVYIPRGMAHGFLSLARNTAMCYLTETEHSPEHDQGVFWHGCGIKWPMAEEEILLSPRDRSFVKLVDFDTPF